MVAGVGTCVGVGSGVIGIVGIYVGLGMGLAVVGGACGTEGVGCGWVRRSQLVW